MQVAMLDGTNAVCTYGDVTEQVDLSLIDGVEVGSHILVFMGRATELLTPGYAKQISNAIEAVERARRGQGFDHLIADLFDRTPELPPHLKPEYEGQG